jgi:hypothetical protein
MKDLFEGAASQNIRETRNLFDLIILVYWYTKTHNVIDVGAGDL